MDTVKRQIMDMLQTLNEATDQLFGVTDAAEEMGLLLCISDFANVIADNISGLVEEEIEAVLLLRRFDELLKCEPKDYESVKEYLCDITNVIMRSIIKVGLVSEKEFSKYVEAIVDASNQNYCVLIASGDTPCGSPNFTKSIGARLCAAGIRTNLFNKWRASYGAVIDAGELVSEKISDTRSVKIKCKLGNNDIEIESVGYGKADAVRGKFIKINGRQVAVGGTGLSIVILDKGSGEIIDSVCFNTYSANIECVRHGDSEAVLEFKRIHPGVTFITPHFPKFPTENLSDNERWIIENKVHQTDIKLNPMLPSVLWEYVTEPEGIVEILTAPPSYIGTDGARHFEDYTGKYVNTNNGRRVTTGQPENPKRTIFVLGGCVTLGIGVRDEGTLASQLQKRLNEDAQEHGFIVENYASALNGLEENAFLENTLWSLPVKPGDIVVGFGKGIFAHSPALDERPYKHGELFYDDVHLTETAQLLAAEGILSTLKQNNFFEESIYKESLPVKEPALDYGLSAGQTACLNKYKQELSEIVKSEFGEYANVGAIVMNCNPFTLGHRYLIEESAKKVDGLLVFVVQEDKSFFPFEARINLVKEGVSDLLNVRVIPSGEFIISTLTFKEYFNKVELQDKTVDSITDVTLFAREIAPAAKIQIRFAGSEPIDKVTNQYNMALSRILPKHGIRFEEIPRKEGNGEVISASRVRALLKSEKWETIRGLVPDVTYLYLRSLYSRLT